MRVLINSFVERACLVEHLATFATRNHFKARFGARFGEQFSLEYGHTSDCLSEHSNTLSTLWKPFYDDDSVLDLHNCF